MCEAACEAKGTGVRSGCEAKGTGARSGWEKHKDGKQSLMAPEDGAGTERAR